VPKGVLNWYYPTFSYMLF